MDFATILLFAMAVSADGFMVGISYGINKIRIPVFSMLVISLASALAVTISMLLGKGLAHLLMPQLSSSLGALLIMFVGIYLMLGACREMIGRLELEDEQPLVTLSIKSLGIIVRILKEPARADFDESGEISTREAFFLGVALALDALGAGVGMAMTGCNILYTAIAVGMVKFIGVNSGMALGSHVNNKKLQGLPSLLPGLLLLIIGLIEIV